MCKYLFFERHRRFVGTPLPPSSGYASVQAHDSPDSHL